MNRMCARLRIEVKRITIQRLCYKEAGLKLGLVKMRINDDDGGDRMTNLVDNSYAFASFTTASASASNHNSDENSNIGTSIRGSRSTSFDISSHFSYNNKYLLSLFIQQQQQ